MKEAKRKPKDDDEVRELHATIDRLEERIKVLERIVTREPVRFEKGN